MVKAYMIDNQVVTDEELAKMYNPLEDTFFFLVFNPVTCDSTYFSSLSLAEKHAANLDAYSIYSEKLIASLDWMMHDEEYTDANCTGAKVGAFVFGKIIKVVDDRPLVIFD